MKSSLLLYAVISAWLFLWASPSAEGTVVLDDSLEMIAMGRHIEYLVDPAGLLTINDVSSAGAMHAWNVPLHDGLGFGFTESVYWVRFSVENRAGRDVRYIIEQEYPLIDSLEMYSPAGRGFRKTATGDYRPHRERPMEYRTFLFPLTAKKGAMETHYLRYKTTSSLNIPLFAWSPRFLEKKIIRENQMLFLFYGVILVMALYNLLLFMIVRWAEHLYFSLMLITGLLFTATQNGTAFQVLWPDSPWFANFCIPLSLCTLFIFIMMFNMELLELRTQRKRSRLRSLLWKATILLLGIDGLLLIACLFLPYRFGMVSSAVAASVQIVFALFLYATLLFAEKNRQATFALFVGAPVIAGTLVYIFKTFMLLPTNLLTEWSVHIGLLFVAVLFSIILADKIRGINRELSVTHRDLMRKDAEAVENEERIFRLRYFDSLTDLPNRCMLDILLQKEIFRGRKLAVLCMGIDNIKNINDMYGFAAGDSLIRAVSKKLKDTYFSKDVVGRIDPHKFMVILSNIGDSASEIDLDNLEKIALKARNISLSDFMLDGVKLRAATSIGLSIYPDDGDEPDTLIKSCESAMYAAREKGGVKIQYFDSALNEKMLNRLKMERDLADAIGNNEFLVHYQPKVDSMRRITGMEALVRWNSRTKGLIAPGEFIHLAEKNGMIVDIGRLVFETACLQSRAWRDMLPGPVSISVNLSPYQFAHEDLLKDIGEILLKTGVAPGSMELEITESGIMYDEDEAVSRLRSLRDMGISISIDDFGTGYSSLKRLKSYPVSTLKIDRSFVEHLPGDKSSAVIAGAIISMGHDLGFSIVAEGIETEEQFSFLNELRCDQFQGYLFYKPLSPVILEAILGSELRGISEAI